MGLIKMQVEGNKEDIKEFLKSPGRLKIVGFKGKIRGRKETFRVVGEI